MSHSVKQQFHVVRGKCFDVCRHHNIVLWLLYLSIHQCLDHGNHYTQQAIENFEETHYAATHAESKDSTKCGWNRECVILDGWRYWGNVHCAHHSKEVYKFEVVSICLYILSWKISRTVHTIRKRCTNLRMCLSVCLSVCFDLEMSRTVHTIQKRCTNLRMCLSVCLYVLIWKCP